MDLKRLLTAKKPGGVSVPLTFGLIATSLIFGTFVLDLPLYFSTVRFQQTSADAAALAGAHKLFTDTSSNAQTRLTNARAAADTYANENGFDLNTGTDVTFGYSTNVATGFNEGSDSPNFSATGGYNAMKVEVKSTDGSANGPVPALLGTILGKDGYNATTGSAAMYGTNVTGLQNLRPLYVCHGAWDAAVASGDPTNQLVTLYNNNLTVGSQVMSVSQQCGDLPPGSFGFADFNLGHGAPGASTVRQWWANGYSGQVNIGQAYTPQPGNQINSYRSELTTLQDQHTIISLPMYRTSSGQGSNAQFVISGFVGFVITDMRTTGSASSRYIRGYFRKLVCDNNCVTSGAPQPNGAVAHLKLVH